MERTSGAPRKKSIFLSVNRAWRSILPPVAQENDVNAQKDNTVKNGISFNPSPRQVIPTFGNITQNSNSSKRSPSIVLEENGEPQILTSRSSPNQDIPPINLVNVSMMSNRSNRKLKKMRTSVMTNSDCDFDDRDIDSSPTLLKEYKYRRMDSVMDFVIEQPQNPKKELKTLNSLTSQSPKRNEVQLDGSGNFENSQAISNKSPKPFDKRNDNQKLISYGSQHWVPSFIQKTPEV